LFSATLANENLFISYDSQKLDVWRKDSLELKKSLHLSSAVINFALFDADPNYLICSGQTGEIMMLNLKTYSIDGRFSNSDNMERSKKKSSS